MQGQTGGCRTRGCRQTAVKPNYLQQQLAGKEYSIESIECFVAMFLKDVENDSLVYVKGGFMEQGGVGDGAEV